MSLLYPGFVAKEEDVLCFFCIRLVFLCWLTPVYRVQLDVDDAVNNIPVKQYINYMWIEKSIMCLQLKNVIYIFKASSSKNIFFSVSRRRALTSMARPPIKSLWSLRWTWLSPALSATSLEKISWPSMFLLVSWCQSKTWLVGLQWLRERCTNASLLVIFYFFANKTNNHKQTT